MVPRSSPPHPLRALVDDVDCLHQSARWLEAVDRLEDGGAPPRSSDQILTALLTGAAETAARYRTAIAAGDVVAPRVWTAVRRLDLVAALDPGLGPRRVAHAATRRLGEILDAHALEAG